MGPEATAILGHSIPPAEWPELPARLDAFFMKRQASIRLRYKHGWGFDFWEQPGELQGTSFWKPSDRPTLVSGPFGTSLQLGAHGVLVNYDVNWDHFLFDTVVQQDVRTFTKLLAEFFGSGIAVYGPDDIDPYSGVADRMLFEGWDLDKVCSELRHFEAPRSQINEMIGFGWIREQRCWHAQGHYIENMERET